MRTILPLHEALFTKNESIGWQPVVLPHTWNAQDGQDGGNDYDRGAYQYKITLPKPTPGKRQFIQFEGANHIATVWCNGQLLGRHEGGFSTFRFELTQVMQAEGNELLVTVDNRSSHVYPQQADFTFFGGLYRPVTFIELENAHFNLLLQGTGGVFITPEATTGTVRVDAFVDGALPGDQVCCRLLNHEKQPVAEFLQQAQAHTVLKGIVYRPQLWAGLTSPYCYTAQLTLLRGGSALDAVCEVFGFRSFEVKPDTGFWLNGQRYPLHGVCRHQDRLDMGWAITETEHREDMELIRQVGANTIRLAHYQHSGYFYDLCDEAGMVLWAEIPFISSFMPGEAARANTFSQLTELIAQNYNHPSIFFWGIANELTIGPDSPALVRNLHDLHALAVQLDPSRPTVMAQLGSLEAESEHNQITDLVSYNHYYGWYGGQVADSGAWLDAFHRLRPGRRIGVSEYGAEGSLRWHSAQPRVQDYTEEYQALYHEQMLRSFETRPYLWATHVWNMFDFAADSRDEGGCKGRNNKGLVSYDRRVKKDSFFLYQAFWTATPMVHVCGRRFARRAPGQRDVQVYSNCSQVMLRVNGEIFATKACNKVVLFQNVPLAEGENKIVAHGEGAPDDAITLWGVPTPEESYILASCPAEGDGAANWFDETDR